MYSQHNDPIDNMRTQQDIMSEVSRRLSGENRNPQTQDYRPHFSRGGSIQNQQLAAQQFMRSVPADNPQTP